MKILFGKIVTLLGCKDEGIRKKVFVIIAHLFKMLVFSLGLENNKIYSFRKKYEVNKDNMDKSIFAFALGICTGIS